MEMFTSRRESLIENRQVSNYQRQHAEPDAGFQYRHSPCPDTDRRNIAEAKGEKSCAAVIEISKETGSRADSPYPRSNSPVDHRKPKNDGDRPDHQESEQG